MLGTSQFFSLFAPVGELLGGRSFSTEDVKSFPRASPAAVAARVRA